MQNVGVMDRAVRILIGTSLIVVAARYSDTDLVYAGIFGLVLLATGLFGWCAIYQLFGWNSKTEPSGGEEMDAEDGL